MSGLCVVHCLVLPVVVSLLPLWPAVAALDAWVHPFFALLLVPTTLLAAASGLRQHRQRRIAGWLGAGLVIVLAASGLGLLGLEDTYEAGFTLLGGGLLISGHWRNWQANRCCEEAVACPGHTDHDHPDHPHAA